MVQTDSQNGTLVPGSKDRYVSRDIMRIKVKPTTRKPKPGRSLAGVSRCSALYTAWVLYDFDDFETHLTADTELFHNALAELIRRDPRLGGAWVDVATSPSGRHIWLKLREPHHSHEFFADDEMREWYLATGRRILKRLREVGAAGGRLDTSAWGPARYGRLPGWRILSGPRFFQVRVLGANNRTKRRRTSSAALDSHGSTSSRGPAAKANRLELPSPEGCGMVSPIDPSAGGRVFNLGSSLFAFLMGCTKTFAVPLGSTHEEMVRGGGPRPQADAWVGLEMEQLVRELGAPQGSFEMPSGGVVLTYSREKTITKDPTVMTTQGSAQGAGNQNTQAEAVLNTATVLAAAMTSEAVQSQAQTTVVAGGGSWTVACDTNFEIDAANIVVGVSERGDGCGPMGADPPIKALEEWRDTEVAVEVNDIAEMTCRTDTIEATVDQDVQAFRSFNGFLRYWEPDVIDPHLPALPAKVELRICRYQGVRYAVLGIINGVPPIPISTRLME